MSKQKKPAVWGGPPTTAEIMDHLKLLVGLYKPNDSRPAPAPQARASLRYNTFKPEVAEIFISRLQKVRSLGNNRYIACCSGHDDKHPSLSITITDDRLLTFCHSQGCDHESVLAGVGMTYSDFYEDKWEAARYGATSNAGRKFKPMKAISIEQLDRTVLMVAESRIRSGEKLTLEDQARLELALARLKHD